MSIRIYDGLLIERDFSLLEARTLTVKARPKFDAVVEAAQTQAMASAAASAHDRALAGRRDPQLEGSGEELSNWRNALSAGAHSVQEQRDQDKRGERTWIPMSFEACLIPIGPGKTLALAFGDRDLQKDFAKLLKAKDYGYWDNTDPPADVDARQWSQRKRDWRKALGQSMQLSPSEAGLTIQLVSSKYKQWWHPEAEAVARAVESDPKLGPAARAKRMARDELLGILMRERESEFKDQPLSAFMRVHRESEKALEGEAGQARVAALAAHLEPFIPFLTIERLKKPLQDVESEGEALRLALREAQALSQEASIPETAPKPPRL